MRAFEPNTPSTENQSSNMAGQASKDDLSEIKWQLSELQEKLNNMEK